MGDRWAATDAVGGGPPALRKVARIDADLDAGYMRDVGSVEVRQ